MKTLLITGASSGIGRATALMAAEKGYQVIACGRNQERLAEVAAEHANIQPLVFDVTDRAGCTEALAVYTPDIVLLNAGTCEYVDIGTFDSDLFHRVMDTNFFGSVNCIEALLPRMRSGSQLVFVDSLARLLPFTRSEAYGASKAAVYYLAKSLDVDLRSRGIRVQTISPGFVKTPLTDKNEFDMPQQVSAEQAAQSILSFIAKGTRSGYFPVFFSACLRVLASLPSSVQTAVCLRLRKQTDSR